MMEGAKKDYPPKKTAELEAAEQKLVDENIAARHSEKSFNAHSVSGAGFVEELKKKEKESLIELKREFGDLVTDTLHRISKEVPAIEKTPFDPHAVLSVDTSGQLNPFDRSTEANRNMQRDMNRKKGDAEHATDAIAKSGLDLDLSEPATAKPAEKLIQVETKPGLAWTEPKSEIPLGRPAKIPEVVKEEPFVQVETDNNHSQKSKTSVAAQKKEEDFQEMMRKISEVREKEAALTEPVVREVSAQEKKHKEEKKVVDGKSAAAGRARARAEVLKKKREDKLAVETPIETTINLRQEDVPPYIREGLVKEERNQFLGVMARAKEMLGVMSERGGKLKSYLAGRIKELDTALAEKSERWFAKLGDKYNKLPVWQKVALGGSLAVGYGFTLPISSWLAGAYAAPLVATRVAAMAGSFRNNQRLLESINKGEAKGRLANTKLYKWLANGPTEESRKNAAMAKALVQSFGMTAAMAYTAHELAEHHVAERLGQWINEHVFGHDTTPAQVAPETPIAPSEASAASEVVHPPASIETPNDSVDGLPKVAAAETVARPLSLETAAGSAITEGPNLHIDEDTRKNALEWLTEKESADADVAQAAPAEVPVAPEASAPAATAAAGEVATPVAAEVPKVYAHAEAGHTYEYMAKRLWEQLHDSSRSVKLPEGIDPNSDLAKLFNADKSTIDAVVHDIAKDNLAFTAEGGSVRIDEGMHMTIEKDGMIHLFDQHGKDFVKMPPEPHVIPGLHNDVPVAEAAPAPVEAKVETVPSPAPEAPVVEAPAAMPQPEVAPAEAPLPEIPTTEIKGHEPVQRVDITQGQEEAATQAPAPVIEKSVVINSFGIRVPVGEPHIYADAGAKHLFVYGGSPAERAKAIVEYLAGNRSQIVYGSDATGAGRIPYYLDESGELTVGEPVRKSFLGRLFSSDPWIEAPKPDEFAKIIK